ncbi:FAD-dependent oxidoreductase [Paenibacillus albiflavus]|uniref:FAD-dependent oxidoreductase n=1 Tax=Paenibacillus albiflavus TaxID=2545760 RepID=A0A4R4EBB6_9BACL|nr:FAD-dependent oxidoreductase [Paenibacillus albiflavus]TCZ77166.1 FAD-dependent oxidoreductase [Paenibacillus albiflavus]
MSMKTYDVIVIGGGISGMLAALLLAKKKMKVALIERTKLLGGFFKTINLDGKVLPYGAHHIGLGGNTLKKFFEKIDIDIDIGFKVQDIFHIKIGEKEYEIPIDLAKLSKSLVQYFPHQQNEIIDFFNKIISFSKDLEEDNEHRVAEYFRKTVSIPYIDFLKERFKDETLILLLLSIGPGYGGVNEQDSAFTYISILATYGKGSGYFKDYGKNLYHLLIEKMDELGVEVYLSSHFEIDRFNEHNVQGTLLQNGELELAVTGKKVIVACQPLGILNKAFEQGIIHHRELTKFSKLKKSPTAFRSYLKINKKASLKKGEYIFCPNENIHISLQQYIDIRRGKLPVSIISIFEDDHYYYAMITCNYSSEASYDIDKHETNSFINKQFCEIFGVNRQDIERSLLMAYRDNQSPAFLPVFGWYRNQIGNISLNSLDIIEKRLKNVYFIGHWSKSFGIYGSVLSVTDCMVRMA